LAEERAAAAVEVETTWFRWYGDAGVFFELFCDGSVDGFKRKKIWVSFTDSH
jgi:hypothetical protein